MSLISKPLIIVLLVSMALCRLNAETPQAPVLFYTDIISGPSTGGADNNGVFITLYGSHFGNNRNSSVVFIGGKPAAAYTNWNDSRITIQPGSMASTGPIKVHIPGAPDSNSLAFTFRKGSIFFVAPDGRDSANGSQHSPWRTIAKAAAAMHAGDTTYIKDGVQQSDLDDYNASLAITHSGTPSQPIALIAYPGSNPSIGSISQNEYGLRTPAVQGRPFSHWVIAGLTLRGRNEAVELSDTTDWRIVANDISCPHGGGSAACVEISTSTDIHLFGNTLHDIAEPHSSKLYHSLYFTTDSNHIEVGWNNILHNNSCRGIQFHSSRDGNNSGYNQYDLSVHDNHIDGQVCDGLNFATIDPSKGPVVAYNNLIEHVGRGPDPPDGQSSYACISSPGITNEGAPGSGVASFYHNTLVDCGARGGADAGAFNIDEGSPHIRLEDNTVKLSPSETLLSHNTHSDLITISTKLPAVNASGGKGTQRTFNSDPVQPGRKAAQQ